MSGRDRRANGVVGLCSAVAVFMIAQQIASKAVRDGFFLAQFDVTTLPVATLAAAVVSFGAALYVGRFIATFTPAAAVPVLFAANGLLFLLEAGLVEAAPRTIAAGLYLHTAAFGGAVVSGFWSVINERFDPYSAKRVMGRIAGGATFGGVLGGALTWAFSDLQPRWLLVGFGVSSLLCAAGIGLIARGGRQESKKRERPGLWAGVSVLTQESYPRSIGLIVLLGALMTGTVDYVFKAGAVQASAKSGLVGFFAIFYTIVGVVTFAVQALGSKRILKALGVVPAVGLFPAVAALLLLTALLMPGLTTLVLLRGGAMVIENSMYRSGYELLYTVVPPEQKRSAKVLIDLGCDRLGTAAASGVALLVIAVGAISVDRTLLLTALAAAIAIAAILVVVRAEYVASLANQLRASLQQENANEQAVRLASTFVAGMEGWEDTSGWSSEHSAGATAGHLDRAQLMGQVRARAQEKARTIAEDAVAPSVGVVVERYLQTPLLLRLREVGAEDPALLQSAPALIGQLGDVLLSGREPLSVRLRAAELLATVPSQRCAATLVEALNAPQLRLRRAVAMALLQICSVAPALRPPRRTLTALAVKELKRPARPTGARTAFELRSPFLRDAKGDEIAPSLEMVFLLLGSVGETEELRLALRAITSDDPARRGTGLEYLDNRLPGNLRGRLLSLAERPELTRADLRVSPEVLRELARKLRAGEIDVRGLRSRFSEAKRTEYEHRS